MRFAAGFIGLFALSVALPVSADDAPGSNTTPPAPKDTKKYVDVNKMIGKLDKVKAASSEAVLEYRSGLGKYGKTEKMDLTFADNVKVWFSTPPEKIDENGDSRKMTPAELDKIKSRSGPTRGLYAAEMANLHAGQQVQVVLSKLKETTKPAPKDKNAAPEKEFLYVTQIVVTYDPKPPTKPDKK